VFRQLSEINWVKGGIFVGAVIVLWAGLQGVIPEVWYNKIGIVLAAVASMIGYILTSKKDKKEEPK
jgi:hypothetical protein